MFDWNNFYLPYSSHIAKYSSLLQEGKCILTFTTDLKLIGFLLLSVLTLDKIKLEKINVYVVATTLALLMLYIISKLGVESEFLYFQF